MAFEEQPATNARFRTRHQEEATEHKRRIVRTVRRRQMFARGQDMGWFLNFSVCVNLDSGEYVLASLAASFLRLYYFLSRGAKIPAEVEVTLTENLLGVMTGCDVDIDVWIAVFWFADRPGFSGHLDVSIG